MRIEKRKKRIDRSHRDQRDRFLEFRELLRKARKEAATAAATTSTDSTMPMSLEQHNEKESEIEGEKEVEEVNGVEVEIQVEAEEEQRVEDQVVQTCNPLFDDPLFPPGIYAPSGFDMFKILVWVRSRPNPKIDLGSVDSSCALVVCDLESPDSPIVYCSPPFEVLTGYTKQEVLGSNCRFLQAPDGKVSKGVKRTHTDDRAVYELKTMISAREEVQTTIVNYKKGGQPFINILTTIPIKWDNAKTKYMIGFQVDKKDCYI